MQDPILTLEKEHEHALQKLDELDSAIRPLESASARELPAESCRTISGILTFINTEVRSHNEKEEVALFPLLDQYVQGPTHCMRDEHRILWDRLEAAQEELAKGESLDASGLLQNCRAIIELLTNHIAKENQVLFPMARNYLKADEMDKVGERMTEIAAKA